MKTRTAQILYGLNKLFRRTANKWFVLAFIGLALNSPAQAVSSKLTADQVLDGVLEAYQNLKSLRFVVTRVDTTTVPADQVETEVAESKPGKVWLSNKHYDLVSNGETTWTYVRQRNEYVQIGAAPLLGEAWSGSDLGLGGDITDEQYLYNWLDLVGERGGAKLRNDERLKVGGKYLDCYIIDIPISRHLGARDYSFSRRLWVEKLTFFVWREEATTPEGAVEYPTASGIITLVFKEIKPGPIPEEVFEFVPPTGARRVDSFPGAGFFHRWSDVDAYDPPAAQYSPSVLGRPAPDFVLLNLAGKQVRLSELRGKIVVLDFWASWCKPCQKEFSDIQKFSDELGGDVVFVGIDDEDPEAMKTFVKSNGYTFPMLDDRKQTAHQLYGVRWAPTTVVIDRKGNIAALWIGAGGEAQLRKALAAAGLDTSKP